MRETLFRKSHFADFEIPSLSWEWLTAIFNLSLSFSTNFHTTSATMGQLWKGVKNTDFNLFVFTMHLMGWKFHGIIINIHRGKIQYDQSSECDCFWWGLSLQCKGKQPWVAKVLHAFILKQNFNPNYVILRVLLVVESCCCTKRIFLSCPLSIADPSW